MKQYITQKQWDDISNNDKEVFRRNIGEWTGQGKFIPNIGQMIEFLDEINWNIMFTTNGRIAIPLQKYLCDILWETVKYKLKQ